MRYIEFEFHNFKGIEHLTLDLSGDVTTLIGLNESGKTTILEAIFCFTYGAEKLDVLDPGMSSLREPEKWIPISRRANFNDEISIAASIEFTEQDRQRLAIHMRAAYDIELSTLPDVLTVKEVYKFENSRFQPGKGMKYWDLDLSGTTGQQRNPRDYDSSTAQWRGAIAYIKTQLPKIWYFPNFLFELPEKFFLTTSPSAAPQTPEDADKNAFYRTTFEKVLGEVGIDADLDTHVVDRLRSDQSVDRRNLRSVLLEMSRIISRTMFDGWSRIFGVASSGQEVDIDAGEDKDGSTFLELKIKGADGYYDLSERSVGFRWFFMFLLMTSYNGRRSTDDDRRPLFLLDEPASNLHSTAQAELLKSFEKLAQNCHLVYTTHSHHLINVRWLDSAYVVKNTALGELNFEDYLATRVSTRTSITATPYRTFVATHPSETSYFQPVLDLLNYRPSILEPVPDVVLVEGKSDFYLMRYAIDVLKRPSNVRLVPGMGAGALAPLIRLHIGWGRGFAVLLDGDREGLRQRERYESEFGPFVANRCITLPEACNDNTVIEVEDILTLSDRMIIATGTSVQVQTTPPTKKSILQGALELYSAQTAVALDPATLDRFDRIFRFLERQLAALQ